MLGHPCGVPGHSYQLGVTEFADQAPEEFASARFGLAKSTKPWADLPYLGRDERLAFSRDFVRLRWP